MAKNARAPLKGFRGLNNVVDPLRLDPAFQTVADNVDITREGEIVRARGFAQSTTNFAISGAYATADLQRLYLVDAGELRQYHADLTYRVLATGLASDRTYFAEVNGVVYYANGTDYGAIDSNGVRAWGLPSPAAPDLAANAGPLPAGLYRVCCTFVDARGLESGSGDVATIETTDDATIVIDNIPSRAGCTVNVYVTAANGAVFYRLAQGAVGAVTYNAPPEQLGPELEFWMQDGPRGTLPAYFNGRIYLAEWFPSLDLTVLWASKPLDYHHFDYSSDGIVVPGHVLTLAACAEALIVATEREIYAYDGEKLTKLADYGTVAGYPATRLGPDLYFWTLRGMCKALPFVNLTEHLLSVPPGIAAAASVIERDGQRRFVVALQKGGSAYNARA